MREVPPPLRLVPRRGPCPAEAPRPPGWPAAALVTVALLALLAALALHLLSDRRALRAIPPAERAALLTRSVADLRRFCGEDRPAALADHCRELAAFAARFEECRGECDTLVHRQLTPIPTR